MILKLAITSLIVLIIVGTVRMSMVLLPLTERAYCKITDIIDELILVLVILTVLLFCAFSLITLWG